MNKARIPLLLVPLLSLAGVARGRRPEHLPRRPRPIDALLARKVSELVHGPGRITPGKVQELACFATDSGGGTRAGSWALRLLVKRYSRKLAPGALEAARALIDRPPTSMKRPDNALFRVKSAADIHQTRDQELYIKGDGTVSQSTGIRTYSRGWLQSNRSPLSRSHGSPVPRSRCLSAHEREALSQATPGQRLDRAAKLLLGRDRVGLSSFNEMATGSTFSRPDQPDWSGFCYSWAHCALDSRLSRMVDVRGKPGERGLWIAGQWLSRADLGNWLSAAASAYAQGEGQVMWFNPQAEDLVKASLGYLMKGGKGFRADIGPALKNPGEVWFQPVTGAKVKIASIPAAARQQVLSLAARPERTGYGTTSPGVRGSDVKLIRIRARYGDETGDGHEGPPAMSSIRWNAYAVLDSGKKAVRFYMANDPKLAGVPGLPTRASSALPRDMFVPEHWFVDAILNDIPEPSLKNSLYGPHLRFLVGDVLARGVPGRTRAAFEGEAALRVGRLERGAAKDLARRYPTVANAYTPEQWERHFGARGLDARRFGGGLTREGEP